MNANLAILKTKLPKRTEQNQSLNHDIAKVTANRANLLIPVSSLILYFKIFLCMSSFKSLTFPCLLRLYHIDSFESLQVGKP